MSLESYLLGLLTIPALVGTYHILRHYNVDVIAMLKAKLARRPKSAGDRHEYIR